MSWDPGRPSCPLSSELVPMSDQVTAALISGGIATIVALLGIAGAIVAQLFATRRSFENSLLLFERQQREQERAKRDEAEREDSYRFAEQRRSTYARFLSLARDLVDAQDAEATAKKNLERIVRQFSRVKPQQSPGQATVEAAVEEAERTALEMRQRVRDHRQSLAEALEAVDLLASANVREAASSLYEGAGTARSLGASSYAGARAAFLDAARTDLGITGSAL